MALPRLGLVCLDCEDPAGLAAFWAALLGGEATPLGEGVVMVKSHGTALAAVRIAGYQPPTWPDPAIPKQLHLDLSVGDLDAAEAEAVRLGARRAGEQPEPARWRVMLDPAGHPFCLCDWGQSLPLGLITTAAARAGTGLPISGRPGRRRCPGTGISGAPGSRHGPFEMKI